MRLQIKSRIRVGANIAFAAAMLLLLGTSCIKEHLADGGTPLKPNEAEVVMRLKTPGSFSSSGGTRGLTVTQENDIDDIYVLVFDKNNELSDIKQGRDISAPGGGAFNIRTFTATFAASRTDLDKYNLVVLANAASVLTATIGTDFGSFSGSKAYADIWPRLTAAITGKMFASGGTIPMWGETGQIVVQAGASANVDLPLHRAIARIDVGVGVPTTVTDATGAKEYEWTNPTGIPFSIDEVYVFRPDDKYSLIPDPANFTDKAAAPTVPTLSTRFAADVSEAKFKFSGLGDITGGLYTTQNIYVPEADIKMGVSGKPGDANHENRMAVIVGGSYKGASTSYYRLDFVKDGALLDILRNHLYQFNIKAVTGPGYPDPETAYKSLALNMTVEVTAWNDAEITDVVFDGQNYLGVSPAEFILYRDAKTGNRFTVKTDVSAGWAVTGVTDSPLTGGVPVTWIKNISGSFTGVGSKDAVTFDVEENTTPSARTAYIHIKAGRLSFAVTVKQGITPDIGVWITDASSINEIPELVFSSAAGVQPAAQSFLLRWAPASSTVYITKSPAVSGGMQFIYGSSDTPGEGAMTSIVGGTSGEQLLSVQPTALTPGEVSSNPFLEKASKVEFTVSSGGSYASRSIYLRQINFNTIADIAAYYMLNGSSYSFTIRSNTAWVVKAGSLSDPDGILDSSVDITSNSGGYNTSATLGSGNTFNFKLITDATGVKNGKTVTFTLTDPTGRMGDVPVTILGQTCGMGGTAVTQTIGGNSYLTHMYGGKCWMVQNSMEGTGSGKAYGLNWAGANIGTLNTGTRGTLNGYYYTWAQAAGACPAGWRLPTEAEFTTLKGEVNADLTGKGKWWSGSLGSANGAFAGHYSFSGTMWYDWNGNGYWWSSVSNQDFRGTTGSMGGPYTNANDWFSVRCVQN